MSSQSIPILLFWHCVRIFLYMMVARALVVRMSLADWPFLDWYHLPPKIKTTNNIYYYIGKHKKSELGKNNRQLTGYEDDILLGGFHKPLPLPLPLLTWVWVRAAFFWTGAVSVWAGVALVWAGAISFWPAFPLSTAWTSFWPTFPFWAASAYTTYKHSYKKSQPQQTTTQIIEIHKKTQIIKQPVFHILFNCGLLFHMPHI